MGSSASIRSFLWTYIMSALAVSNVLAHMCMREPRQRLQDGDELKVDCYQTKGPPCGQNFPSTPTANPDKFPPGSAYPVHLYMPVTHLDPANAGRFEINIAKVGSQNFTQLGKWQDGPEETRYLKVQLPAEPGKYILQAIYIPYDHGQYYSCADIIIEPGAAPPTNRITGVTDADDNSAQDPQPHLLLLVGLSLAARWLK